MTYRIKALGDIGDIVKRYGEAEKQSSTLFILRVESKPGQKKSIIDLLNNPSVISSEVLRKEILYDDGSVQDLEEV